MINVQLKSRNSFWADDSEGFLFLLPQDFKIAGNLGKVEELYPHLQQILTSHKFKGQKGQSYILTHADGSHVAQFIFLGMGDAKKDGFEAVRRALGTGIKLAKKLAIKKTSVELPDAAHYGFSQRELVKQLTTISWMAAFDFERFKSKAEDNVPWTGSITLHADGDHADLDQAVAEGNIIGQAINSVRDRAILPGNIATPTYLAQEAKKMCEKHGLKYTCFGREKALELNMGGFCAVDSGSAQPGQFVIMEYSCGDSNAPTIALVGKGITFDTGGVSLKPSASMTGMKYDMSGASAVIGAMEVFAQFKPKVNVVGITPLVENMPGGNACRQDDIITHMNGKTTEIENTDAEGRLILSDSLCYAEKYFKPVVMLDAATLTGACPYALGPLYSGLLSADEELKKELTEIGQFVGDKMWALPFDDEYREAIKSKVADLTNCGSKTYMAGTITAGLYLSNFVKDARWAHLDIAGTADGVPGVSYLGGMATGSSMRVFVEYVMRYSKKHEMNAVSGL